MSEEPTAAAPSGGLRQSYAFWRCENCGALYALDPRVDNPGWTKIGPHLVGGGNGCRSGRTHAILRHFGPTIGRPENGGL